MKYRPVVEAAVLLPFRRSQAAGEEAVKESPPEGTEAKAFKKHPLSMIRLHPDKTKTENSNQSPNASLLGPPTLYRHPLRLQTPYPPCLSPLHPMFPEVISGRVRRLMLRQAYGRRGGSKKTQLGSVGLINAFGGLLPSTAW